jgi:hypothetical protein
MADLIGLDVGFSIKRPSSGVARLSPSGELRVGHAMASWESRASVVGSGRASVAAIDAPYTRLGLSEKRGCERIFLLGRFQKRCKPGLSHVRGTGQSLRAAGRETADQLKVVVESGKLGAAFPRVESFNLVEAFPNAYLGVCVAEDVYVGKPRLRRGKKFDWLYDSWVSSNLFQDTTQQIRLPSLGQLGDIFGRTKQHDERAALVCLLTAAGVFTGNYTAAGDPEGGYFFLPPWGSWAKWAKEELDLQRGRVAGLEIWVAGERFLSGETLPD